MKRNPNNLKAWQVYNSSNGLCAYCGQSLTFDEFTIDHVVPRSRGGVNELFNLLCSCKSCNSSKGNKNLEEYRLFMRLNSSRYAGIITPKQLTQLEECGIEFKLPNHKFYFEVR